MEDQVKAFIINLSINYIIIHVTIIIVKKAADLVKDAENCEEMTRILIDFAVKNGSRDNVSFLVIKL